MTIYVGTVSKEINSTFRPTLTTTIDVQIKDGCSFLSPVLIFNENVWSESYNYCYIPKWNRYYFLHDAVIQGPRWFVTCACDVLASWRSQILASSAYVARSASDYTLDLPDGTWSHGSAPAVSETTVQVTGLSSTGCFLLYTSADDENPTLNTSVPSLSVYALTGEQVKRLCNYLFSNDFLTEATSNLDNSTKQLASTFFNPFQYVVKCMWLPIDVANLPVSPNSYPVKFGWWVNDNGQGSPIVSAPILTSNYHSFNFDVTLGSYTDWKDRSADWTNIMLYIPGFGHLAISPEFAGQTLSCRIVNDLATGKSQLMIRDGNSRLVQSATGRMGCDIQLSSLYEDYINDLGSKGTLIKGAVGAAAGAAKGLSGAIKSIGHNIKEWFTGSGNYQQVDLSTSAGEMVDNVVSGAQAALQPSMSTVGINDGMALIQQNTDVILTIIRFARYADNHTSLGGICARTRALSGLSGYTEVVNPNVEAPATSAELLQISAFLRGGFYIE